MFLLSFFLIHFFSTCQNGGTCIDSVDGYVCQCAPGFVGSRCERSKGLIKTSSGITREGPSKCTSCAQKAGNGKCDEECNLAECDYDGNDCLVKNPFDGCPSSSFCALVFKNGVCDEVCNNEACLFDGFDCMTKEPVCPEAISAYCKKHKSDGICDEQCNQEGCDFDGGDCQGISNKILSGELSVVVLADPSYFVANAPRFLRSLSKTLRAEVRIKRDQKGLMIFAWNEGEIGERVEIDRLEMASDAQRTDKRGIIVWIEVDVAGCVEECFSDVEVVASFIQAAREKLTDMNMTIYSADAKLPRKGRTSLDVSLLILLACITVMIVIAILFIVHERPSRKRKVIENAPVWIPPTEFENEKTNGYSESNWQRRVILESAKRRRIDHSEMKLLEEQLTPKGPKVPRVFVLPKAKKIEPLPSRLHIEAASANPISIPIAAEDVNQRGPNGRTPVMVLVRNTTKTEEQIIEELTRLRSAGADLNLWDDCEFWTLCSDFFIVLRITAAVVIRLPIVRKLLELGASPVIRDHKNSTCLHLAARICSLDMVKALLEVEEMKMEVDAVDDDNRTALMLVAMHDRVDAKIAEALCAAGAKVNYDGDNTLSTWTGRTALHFAAKYDNAQMVAFLLEKNANKDCQDHECCTPLHLAASEGHEGPVKELIKAGASVMLRNDKSQTPYDTALVNNQLGVAALLASGDNLRVQLYSNNGEIFASSTPPGIKCAKLLMARHSRSTRVHAASASRASPRSTQSTPTRHPQNAPSPYNGLATPHSMVSIFPSPQFSSTTPRSMDPSYSSPRHMQPVVYSAPQTANKVSESTFHSPQYDARPIYFDAEKSANTHSGYMDSGFGTFTDGSTYDHNSHWSISNEPINRSVLSPHERFVCNEGYIV
ncbi:notch domain protein [Ancylostoma caninum]|uniref:Notch domain protein n=1 Tax=Ancylostoma caninum TaxID=29170 RepID=A0A368GAJ5_ANCCA|nr:notch domain protein [Ancylostoma caninum]